MRVLATDLDGTFLGGSEAARAKLIGHFLEHPQRRLIYVTGRSVNSVQRLIDAGSLPRPDGMICDVGTSVACAQGRPLDGPAAVAIDAAWQDRGAEVLRALEDIDGLRLQDDIGPRRISYTYTEGADLETARARVTALGLEALVSDNVFFDVLPPGINKGSTLRRWLEQHDHAPDEVLVAGDTLNDLALLRSGCPAVAVGNAEPGLLVALADAEGVYRARGHGCDGIVEACTHYGLQLGA